MQKVLRLVVLVTMPFLTNGNLFDDLDDAFSIVTDFSAWAYPASGNIFGGNDQSEIPTPRTNLHTLTAAESCVPSPPCPRETTFRSIDGFCNNLLFPMVGQAGTGLTRIAPADYHDGDHEPRKAKSGRDLPNPRDIVVKAFSNVNVMDEVDTLAVMSVGQLLAHDTSLIAAPLIPPRSCCTEGGPNCMNIAVSPDDPFYSQFNVTCLPMVRAKTTASLGCSLKPQYALNTVTHYVDASFVYGSTDEQASALRTHSQGKLKQELIGGHPYPPHTSKRSACPGQRRRQLCMNTGDTRANQNPPLGALHVIFFREHNRLATELATLNPDWDDERLYQEARRILIGEWQIIVYRDYLPIIIGEDAATAKKLIPDLDNMRNDYNAFPHPGTTVDFTTAAFRVYHSQVPDSFCAKGAKDTAAGCPLGANKFSNSFNDVAVLGTDEGFQSVLSGLDKQKAFRMDDCFSMEVAGKLFRTGKPYGIDLIATDINRCRDLGLATYNTYRSLCGLQTATTWEQLFDTGSFSPRDVENLKSLYESPEDLDVFVASVLEKKFGKAAVGPTFLCLIVDQFIRWKIADRFFVDLKGNAFSFTPEQAKALGNTSLARLFCDNSEGLTEIRKNIFLFTSEEVACNEIPRVDLTAWKGRPTPAQPTTVSQTMARYLLRSIFE